MKVFTFIKDHAIEAKTAKEAKKKFYKKESTYGTMLLANARNVENTKEGC